MNHLAAPRRLVALVLGLASICCVTSAMAAEPLTGILHLAWGDPAPGSGAEPVIAYSLATDDGTVIDLSISRELAALHGGFVAWNGGRVRVSLQEQEPAASGPRPIAAMTLLSSARAADKGGVSGAQPWVSILCKFADIAAEPEDQAYFQNMYANIPGGLDHYWRELSYDAIDIVGSTAIDWVNLPQNQTFYIPTPGSGSDSNRTALFNDCTAAGDPFIDFGNGGNPFVGINMMFNDVLDCCAWGGTRFATLDGISKIWRVTWEPTWGWADVGVIGHEMGHGFGLPHSTNFDDDGFPYDSRWDVMSSATGSAVFDPVYGRRGKHTIAYHKDLLGWIPADEEFVVTDAGIFTITIDRMALATTSNYRMARIPIGGGGTWYTVEVRERVGDYDGNVPGDAVIIHHVDPSRTEPAWAVDADVPPANTNNNEGTMWRAGETFEDPANMIAVEILSMTAAGFQVEIRFGDVGTIFMDGFESGNTSAWSSTN